MKQDYEMLKLSNQLCFPLYVASRQVINAYTPLFKGTGLTYTQYIVLMALWEEDNVTVSELCRRLYLNNGTLTPLLKKMEKDGRITRERSGDDERVVRVRLTKEGLALREKAALFPREMISCLKLPGEKLLELKNMLYELLDSMSNEKPL